MLGALRENVIENEMPGSISRHMNCEGGRLEVSEFIRFERDESELSRDSEEEKVSAFARAWKDESTKWAVFGFASADGEQGGNKELSHKRAVSVKNLLCKALDCDAKGTEITAQGLGEDHSINGVANSRSVRIAVCVNEAPQQTRRTETR